MAWLHHVFLQVFLQLSKPFGMQDTFKMQDKISSTLIRNFQFIYYLQLGRNLGTVGRFIFFIALITIFMMFYF